MGGALRAIGRVVRNIGDNLADMPITEIPWYSLSWLGRGIARLFASNDRDISDAFAIGLGLAFIGLLAIVAFGLFNWLREAPEAGPTAARPDLRPNPGPPDKPWWE